MKTLTILIFCLCLSIILQAQVSKTVHLDVGFLKDALTENELKSITNLTLTGNLKFADYEVINNEMPLLAILDLSDVERFFESYSDNSYPPAYVFEGNTHLTTVLFPPTLKFIDQYVFKNCTALTVMNLSSYINFISEGAFYGCKNLKSINAYSSYPAQLNGQDIFTGVDKTNCTLYVPFGAKRHYNAVEQWRDFKNVVEIPAVSAVPKYVLAEKGSTDSIMVYYNANWTAQTDQEWLHINRASTNGNGMLVVSANANPSSFKRKGIVTISSSDSITQNIILYQAGIPRTLTVTAGKVSELFKEGEIDSTTNLILNGSMNFIDFSTLFVYMPLIEVLDIRDVDITSDEEHCIYCFENEIPQQLFAGNNDWHNLRVVFLPKSITTIGKYSFLGRENLISVNIQDKVTIVGDEAFRGCENLTNINIPASVKSIGHYAFEKCDNLISLSIPESVTSIGKGAFQMCSSLTSLSLPSSISKIKEYTFLECRSLHTITIPKSVVSIESGAFSDCSSLTSITASSEKPIDLTSSDDVFNGVDTYTCSLYVPTGSKELYAAADQWKDFKNIVEMTTSIEGLQALAHFNYYPNPFNQQVTIEIQNPKHTKLTVDIYNLTGQRVKNLAMGNTSLLLNLTWNGTNEMGQQVTPGVYICKMNGQTKQLVYTGTKQ